MKLSEAIGRLERAGVDSPAFDARAIFSLLGRVPQSELLSPDCAVDLPAVDEAVSRREAREPLGYIVGEAGFYREVYRVCPAVLIPRPETELLVDCAVRRLPAGADFLDLCTGSGCVALSVLKHTEKTTATLVDLSEAALAVARENAERLGLSDRAHFLAADAKKDIFAPERRFFAVLCNPPYVADGVYPSLAPEIAREPRAAFLGGADGGDFYRALIPLYRDRLEDGGFLAFEIGCDQAPLLGALAEENAMSLDLARDLSGHPRLAVLTKR